MRYCVIKDTTTVIDGSHNPDDIMIKNAENAGFAVNEIEILTMDEYMQRKISEPQPIPEPTENELLQQRIFGLEQQNKLLEAQKDALADRAEFHEELIAELAMLVYQ